MKIKTLLSLPLLLLLNFQCKKSGICLLVENKTNEKCYFFSKEEMNWYENNFLSKERSGALRSCELRNYDFSIK
jgi:hypothetical protein